MIAEIKMSIFTNLGTKMPNSYTYQKHSPFDKSGALGKHMWVSIQIGYKNS